MKQNLTRSQAVQLARKYQRMHPDRDYFVFEEFLSFDPADWPNHDATPTFGVCNSNDYYHGHYQDIPENRVIYSTIDGWY